MAESDQLPVFHVAGFTGHRSVRDPGGHCLAVWRPRALGPARSDRHIGLHWDGQRITHWYVKELPQPLRPATEVFSLPEDREDY